MEIDEQLDSTQAGGLKNACHQLFINFHINIRGCPCMAMAASELPYRDN
jgi:hypothetical protein